MTASVETLPNTGVRDELLKRRADREALIAGTMGVLVDTGIAPPGTDLTLLGDLSRAYPAEVGLATAEARARLTPQA
jgi:hypothetical protein